MKVALALANRHFRNSNWKSQRFERCSDLQVTKKLITLYIPSFCLEVAGILDPMFYKKSQTYGYDGNAFMNAAYKIRDNEFSFYRTGTEEPSAVATSEVAWFSLLETKRRNPIREGGNWAYIRGRKKIVTKLAIN